MPGSGGCTHRVAFIPRDLPHEAIEPFDKPDGPITVVLTACVVAVSAFFLVLSPVDTGAALAATALFSG